MSNRTMPALSKNPVAATVYWFYQYKWGVKADASQYARHGNKKNPKALYYLLSDTGDPNVAVYEPSDIAMLVYYLEDNGVEINDLTTVSFPGLLASFVWKDTSSVAKSELDRILSYLRKDTIVQDKPFRAPEGW